MGKAVSLYHVSHGGYVNHMLKSIISIGNNLTSFDLVKATCVVISTRYQAVILWSLF